MGVYHNRVPYVCKNYQSYHLRVFPSYRRMKGEYSTVISQFLQITAYDIQLCPI